MDTDTDMNTDKEVEVVIQRIECRISDIGKSVIRYPTCVKTTLSWSDFGDSVIRLSPVRDRSFTDIGQSALLWCLFTEAILAS